MIPGLVEFSRRDYLGFLKILKNIKVENINFIILGNISKLDGPKVYEKIKEHNLERLFTVYSNFVPYEEYFSVLQNSDLIMPLIHPNIENFEKYHTTKITAAFSMAFSFKIPLLVYDTLYELEEFQKFAIGYNMKNLSAKLQEVDRNVLKSLKEKLKHETKFTFDYQKNSYINFLGTKDE